LTVFAVVFTIAGGGSRKGSKGNAVRAHELRAMPRLPPQL
jgi:hypothetical protein